MGLEDQYARKIEYVRLSVTDRCNFRCQYCMPSEDIEFSRKSELLTFEEIERVVTVLTTLGVRRVRLTGGEPTVRAGIVQLVERLAKKVDELVMTTNGVRLGELSHQLFEAGLSGCNISLDSLVPKRFAELTGRDQLDDVVEGIDAAIRAGLKVKVNALLFQGKNEDEIAALCQFAWERGIRIRFIEHMPMSAGALFSKSTIVTAKYIRDVVQCRFGPLEPVPQAGVHGPAAYWQAGEDSEQIFGIISPITEPFCETCNRIRVTAQGALHRCLGYDDEYSLRDILRKGATDTQLMDSIREHLWGKKLEHDFLEHHPNTHMVSLGG